MENSVEKCVRDLKVGEVQQYRGLSIFPVIGGGDGGPEYLTLAEAMEDRLLTIREISEGGSVPELSVANEADTAVLLLDGEELAGAKQNRVLNSTVLLAPRSRTVIPVSCTEQGRWAYESPEFRDSGVVMDHKARHGKMASVSSNLRAGLSHRSDQGRVWQDIAMFSAEARVSSPTGAMRDVYRSRSADYERCLAAFPLLEGQRGLVAFVGGGPAGLDVVSRAGAFARLHDKLVRSYASDIVFGRRIGESAVDAGDCRRFLDRIGGSAETRHPSVGLGEDCRYSSRHICGSALVYGKTCIHGAFFAAEAGEGEAPPSGMSSYRRRRGYRKPADN